MKMIQKTVGISALVLSLANCDASSRFRHQQSVDLNGDNISEIIDINHYEKDYNLVVRNSDPNKKYSEPKLLIKLGYLPIQWHFTDLDGDGDIDLLFSKYGKRHLLSVDYDTFVAKNDGEGNFSVPVLLYRQTK